MDNGESATFVPVTTPAKRNFDLFRLPTKKVSQLRVRTHILHIYPFRFSPVTPYL